MGKAVTHADDFGASAGVNAAIIRSIEEGCVRSVSLLANGAAFDEAVRYLHARPDIAVTLHLNLIEGRPLAAHPDGLLIAANGRLNSTFSGLFLAWCRRGKAQDRLFTEIQREFAAQAAVFSQAFGHTRPLRLDSHGHVHAIPLVWRALLTAPYPGTIAYVRVPQEPFHLPPTMRDLSHAAGANIAKHLVLNRLAPALRRALRARSIPSNRFLVGVLHTRRMTPDAVLAGLAAADRAAEANTDRDQPVEVLVHPGGARADEQDLWRDEPSFWAFYSSPDRNVELATTLSPRLRTAFL